MNNWIHFSVAFLFLGVFSSLKAESISASLDTQSQLWLPSETATVKSQTRTLSDSSLAKNSASHFFEDAKLMTLNENLMRSLLNLDASGRDVSKLSVSEVAARAKGLDSVRQFEISLPLPNGEIIDLSLVKDSVLPDQLAAKYPDINTYKVLTNELVFSGKVDISPSGFHAMIQMLNGEIVFIDPTEQSKSEYAIYNKSTQKPESHRLHSCGLNNKLFSKNGFDVDTFLSSQSTSAREIYLEKVLPLVQERMIA